MRENVAQRIGAAEARWAHNPKVVRSKLTFASLYIFVLLLRRCRFLKKKKKKFATLESYGEKVCSLHVNPEVGKKSKNIFFFNGCRGAKKKVLPGIEPGFRDSESPVITVTLQDPLPVAD